MIDTFADLQVKAKKLISRKELESIIKTLALEIDKRFQYSCLECVVLMNGSYQLAADLSKLLTVPSIMNFQRISRYENNCPSKSLGSINIPLISKDNRPLLVIDDVFDEGITLESVMISLKQQNPTRDVYSLVLLSKKKSRTINYVPNFVGTTIDDVYIFGYGLDLSLKWRHLPEIWEVLS